MSEKVMTPRKNLLQLMWLALLAKICMNTLLMTVCSTSNMRETRREKENTGCCWNKLSNSNRWNPRIQSNASKGVRGIQEEPGRQQENRRKRVACSVAHQSTLIAFHLSWALLGGTCFPFSLGRVCSSYNSFLTQLCSSTHHDVLECHSSQCS